MDNWSNSRVVTWVKTFISDENIIRVFQDEDIDGATLRLLQHDDIVQLLPRIKDRVKFVDQLTKLIESLNERNVDNDVSHHHDLTNSSLVNANEENQNGKAGGAVSPSSNLDCNENNDLHVEPRPPLDYDGPVLSTRKQQCIGQNDPSKFNPHTNLRSEVLSLLFHDVTKNFNVLYPNHDEYMIMARSIVQKLSIPSALTCSATKEWLESIKQKFKRERRPLQMDNNMVKLKQAKYTNGKAHGRPKRKSAVAQAERRTSDVPFINLHDGQNENLLSLANQMKAELLKDNPDNNILRNLWRQSFNIRRLHVRELSIYELFQRYPGYRHADLLLAEVKDSVGVDLNANVENLLPKFFECLPENNCFLSDVLPIRAIRILCKRFGDPVGNVFTYEEVLVPYPCIKILENKFELYLDFHYITETNSCTTALALLLSLYYVFEIRFANHSRCCRLLYSILFEDAHYLNKSLKTLLNDWNYKIIYRPIRKSQTVTMNTNECFTQPSTENENPLSSFNNDTQIDNTIIRQTYHSSSRSTLVTSTSPVQDCSNSNHQNGCDQSSNFVVENCLNRLFTTSDPVYDSQLTSPMILQNETQLSINTQTFTDDLNLQETSDVNALKGTNAEDGEFSCDLPNENTSSNTNFKRKRKLKQNQSSSSTITVHRQSKRPGPKRTRVL